MHKIIPRPLFRLHIDINYRYLTLNFNRNMLNKYNIILIFFLLKMSIQIFYVTWRDCYITCVIIKFLVYYVVFIETYTTIIIIIIHVYILERYYNFFNGYSI